MTGKEYDQMFFRMTAQHLIEYAKHMDEYTMRDFIVEIRRDQKGKIKIKFTNEDCCEIHFSTRKKGKYVLVVTDRDHSDEIKLEKKGLFKRKIIYKGYRGEYIW